MRNDLLVIDIGPVLAIILGVSVCFAGYSVHRYLTILEKQRAPAVHTAPKEPAP